VDPHFSPDRVVRGTRPSSRSPRPRKKPALPRSRPATDLERPAEDRPHGPGADIDEADGRRVFSTEFKRTTVQRTGEKTLAELSRELDVSPSVVRLAEARATTAVQASKTWSWVSRTKLSSRRLRFLHPERVAAHVRARAQAAGGARYLVCGVFARDRVVAHHAGLAGSSAPPDSPNDRKQGAAGQVGPNDRADHVGFAATRDGEPRIEPAPAGGDSKAGRGEQPAVARTAPGSFRASSDRRDAGA